MSNDDKNKNEHDDFFGGMQDEIAATDAPSAFDGEDDFFGHMEADAPAGEDDFFGHIEDAPAKEVESTAVEPPTEEAAFEAASEEDDFFGEMKESPAMELEDAATETPTEETAFETADEADDFFGEMEETPAMKLEEAAVETPAEEVAIEAADDEDNFFGEIEESPAMEPEPPVVEPLAEEAAFEAASKEDDFFGQMEDNPAEQAAYEDDFFAQSEEEPPFEESPTPIIASNERQGNQTVQRLQPADHANNASESAQTPTADISGENQPKSRAMLTSVLAIAFIGAAAAYFLMPGNSEQPAVTSQTADVVRQAAVQPTPVEAVVQAEIPPTVAEPVTQTAAVQPVIAEPAATASDSNAVTVDSVVEKSEVAQPAEKALTTTSTAMADGTTADTMASSDQAEMTTEPTTEEDISLPESSLSSEELAVTAASTDVVVKASKLVETTKVEQPPVVTEIAKPVATRQPAAKKKPVNLLIPATAPSSKVIIHSDIDPDTLEPLAEIKASSLFSSKRKYAEFDKAWAVNLISLPSQSEAEQALRRLRKDGIDSELVKVSASNRVWYRVRVPHLATRKDAEKTMQKFNNHPDFRNAWVSLYTIH